MSVNNDENSLNENNSLKKSTEQKNELNENLENNLYKSDNGKNQEEEIDNNLINYEINNEDEIYQNNINLDYNEEFNKDGNNQDDENEINNENNFEVQENNIEVGEENEKDDEMPLITLNAISVCQCCKNQFNKEDNIPYLFKCGHFFCVKCINQYFKDEKGISCPSDGLIAKSINELKLLKNLIINNDDEKDKNSNIDKENEANFLMISSDKKNNSLKMEEELKNIKKSKCPIHNEQKLTHINCRNNKLICIYCAFDILKSDPNSEIKEIKDKIKEYKENIESIIDNSKNRLEQLKICLGKFKKIKENEEKNLKSFYKKLIEFLNYKEKDQIEKLNSIYKNNIKEIEKNIIFLEDIIEKGNKSQNIINQLKNNENLFFDFDKKYNNLCDLFLSKNHLDKFEYITFKYDNEKEVINYLNNINDIEIKNEFLKFMPIEIKDNKIINDNINYNLKLKDYLNSNLNGNNNNYLNNMNSNKFDYVYKNNFQPKRLNITYNYDSNTNYNLLFNTNFNSNSLQNGIDVDNKYYNQDMPIHSSYLFHRNESKKENVLKEKLYSKYNLYN